jgi:glycosyltransferase involved in cell wall biosynthesis
VSPSLTSSPIATSTFHTLPVMCASMSGMGGENNRAMGPDGDGETSTSSPEEDWTVAVIVAARNEADRIAATVAALRGAFPAAAIWVADDASTDGTAEAAMVAGAQVVNRRRPHGKGANVTAAAEAALGVEPPPRLVLLCDGDLGASAGRLGPLVAAVERGECDLAVAAFSRRVGGGFGIALSFAGWAVRRLCGARVQAPISGQRALRAETLRACLPLAKGFGMEIGMTVDAVRAGCRLREYELDLEHRASGRTLAGFLHRGAQLRDFLRVFLSRALASPSAK